MLWQSLETRQRCLLFQSRQHRTTSHQVHLLLSNHPHTGPLKQVSVPALVSNTVLWWCLHREKKENAWAFTKGFTLLVKPVQAWKAEDQEAKEKSHTMDRQWEQAHVSSGSWRIRRKHRRFNRAWSCLAPDGQSQPLVQMHGCALHSCGSDTVPMSHSKSVCLCPEYLPVTALDGWKGSGGKRGWQNSENGTFVHVRIPSCEGTVRYLSVSSETGA